MKTQSKPVPVETTFGKLYVAVANADPNSYHERGRGNVTDLRPELWVATDAEFKADPNAADHWTIRGRAYALYYHVVRWRGEWQRSHVPHDGGFRDDRRGQVKHQTKTWDQMWEATVQGLDAFHRQTPGWEALSIYMLHEANERGELGRALTARREAEGHDKEAAGHEALKRKAGVGVTPSLMALLNGK